MRCINLVFADLMPAKSHRTSIKLSEEVRQALESRAIREGRAIANMAERLIIAGLIASGDLAADPGVRETRGRKPRTAEEEVKLDL